MNKVSYYMAAALLAVCCNPETTSDTFPETEPKVSFLIEGQEISVSKYDTVRFVADILTEGPVDCRWTLDGVPIASTPSVSYRFDVAGTFAVDFTASNSKGEVSRHYSVSVEGVPVEVEYSLAPGEAQTLLGDPFSIVAEVTSGGLGLSQKWYLGDSLVCESGTFSIAFDSLGVYALRYEAVNEDGKTASASWTVSVTDLPLEVRFSSEPGDLPVTLGDSTVVTAYVSHGSTGLVQEWLLDGAKVSDSSSVVLCFKEMGSHTLVYNARNAADESLQKSWMLSVVELAPTVYETFELLTSLPSWYTGNARALSIAGNPFKTSANSSDKVLQDNMSDTKTGTSGYIMIKTSNDPSAAAAKLKQYDCISVKIYLGANDYFPRIQYNGAGNAYLPSTLNGGTFTDEAGWKALVKTDDWNVFEWTADQIDKTTFSGVQSLTFRMFVDFSNGTKSGYDAATNTRKVWLDDLTFKKL